MKKKFLVIITTNFPYGLREPFLETELFYHAQHFQKIYILVPDADSGARSEISFEIPSNVMVVNFSSKINFRNKIAALKYLLNYSFWNEIKALKKNYDLKLNWKIIKIILAAFVKGHSFSNQLKNFLKSMHLPFKRTILYTYWCTEYSLGIGLLNRKYKIAGAYSRLHNWDLYFERAEHGYLPLRKYIFSLLNGVFPVSLQAKEYLLKKLPSLNQDKMLVSRLGVEKAVFLSQKKTKGKLKILTLAFLGKVKRIDLLIMALEKIQDIEIEWHHIGEGNDHLNITQYAFNRLFNKGNIKYNISGDLTKKQVYEQLSKGQFNLLVNTSQFEGIPVSMMEAMSFGIPVLGTNVGGVSEIIDNSVNGFLMSADPGPDEIISYIKKIDHLNDDDYDKFCRNAYNTWETKFNADLNYSELIYSMLQLAKIYN